MSGLLPGQHCVRQCGLAGPVGVSLDWASLFQKPQDEEESRVFDRGLETLNIWLASACVLLRIMKYTAYALRHGGASDDAALGRAWGATAVQSRSRRGGAEGRR